jgi:hypothetical protein
MGSTSSSLLKLDMASHLFMNRVKIIIKELYVQFGRMCNVYILPVSVLLESPACFTILIKPYSTLAKKRPTNRAILGSVEHHILYNDELVSKIYEIKIFDIFFG